MSANVETMVYTREKPWHGIGTMVQEAPNSLEALNLAGLNWKVEGKPVYTADGFEIPNYKANVRSSDNSVLGIVTDRYKVCQNDEAFSFTDELIGGDVRYETAGSLQGGKKIWLLAKMKEVDVAGDKTEPYVCFTNSHDGTGAIRVCMTPIRVVCNNTLNVALSTAKRSWSTKHMGNIQEKIAEARHTLELAENYMYNLDEYAQKMANTEIKTDEIKKILDELFPESEDATERANRNMKRMKTEYMVCLFAKDLDKFRGTAWGAINAMADMADHNKPSRQTKNYSENNWDRIIDGHPMVDSFAAELEKMLNSRVLVPVK